MRDRSEGTICGWCDGLVKLVVADERRVVCLLICVRAKVRAPAIEVVGEATRVSGEVLARRREIEARRVCWMTWNGLYLFASSERVV